jgi:hypothetical protein
MLSAACLHRLALATALCLLCLLCLMPFMPYAFYALCLMPFMPYAFYALCLLCLMPFMPYAFYALCLMPFMPYALCLLCLTQAVSSLPTSPFACGHGPVCRTRVGPLAPPREAPVLFEAAVVKSISRSPGSATVFFSMRACSKGSIKALLRHY